MLIPIGAVIVLGSVLGGYMMHGGSVLALWQPSEFIIIGGAALGMLVLGTPLPVLKDTGGQLGRLFKPSPARDDYANLLAMLYQMFRLVQQTGVMALESHVEDPAQSSVFSKYPKFLARHESISFVADSVKVLIGGGIAPHDFADLMTEDLEVRQKEALHPSSTLLKVGDALPGLGIVAAVLGVVITMGAIDGPASEVGHKVGAALVGTFIGILASYGFVQPLAGALEHRVHEEAQFEQCIKAGLQAMSKGLGPALAVEFARRIIPEHVRPSFEETEQLCRATRSEAAAA